MTPTCRTAQKAIAEIRIPIMGASEFSEANLLRDFISSNTHLRKMKGMVSNQAQRQHSCIFASACAYTHSYSSATQPLLACIQECSDTASGRKSVRSSRDLEVIKPKSGPAQAIASIQTHTWAPVGCVDWLLTNCSNRRSNDSNIGRALMTPTSGSILPNGLLSPFWIPPWAVSPCTG